MKYILIIIAFFMVYSRYGQLMFEQTIIETENDAEQDVSTMDLTDNYLTFGNKDDRIRYVGLRFVDVSIPKGSEVISAFIQFRAAQNSVSENRSFYIYGHDTAYSLPFTMEDNNLSDRIITSNFVLWEPDPWIELEAGENQKTPNLSAIVQEIVNIEDWKAGNAFSLILQGASPSSGYLEAMSFDEIGITFSPELTITYLEPSSVNEQRTEVNWRIQPNPATHQFSIKLSNMNATPLSIQLLDILGTRMNYLYKGQIGQNEGVLNFNVGELGLKKGIYFILLEQNNRIHTQKLVVN